VRVCVEGLSLWVGAYRSCLVHLEDWIQTWVWVASSKLLSVWAFSDLYCNNGWKVLHDGLVVHLSTLARDFEKMALYPCFRCAIAQ